jgi:hypothetical protein
VHSRVGYPFPFGHIITVNKCGSGVKGRPQAAFFLSAGTVEERGRAVQRSAREIPGAGRRMDKGPDKHCLSVLGAMIIFSVVLRKEVDPRNRL